MFDPTKAKLTFVDVTDGLSNTVMVVETVDPVLWAKPGDLLIDPKKPLPKLTAAGMDGGDQRADGRRVGAQGGRAEGLGEDPAERVHSQRRDATG
jgi:hypothetical protein